MSGWIGFAEAFIYWAARDHRKGDRSHFAAQSCGTQMPSGFPGGLQEEHACQRGDAVQSLTPGRS